MFTFSRFFPNKGRTEEVKGELEEKRKEGNGYRKNKRE